MIPDPLMSLALVIQSITELCKTIAATQTPEQQKIMWDRNLEIVAPFHKAFVRLLEKTLDDK